MVDGLCSQKTSSRIFSFTGLGYPLSRTSRFLGAEVKEAGAFFLTAFSRPPIAVVSRDKSNRRWLPDPALWTSQRLMNPPPQIRPGKLLEHPGESRIRLNPSRKPNDPPENFVRLQRLDQTLRGVEIQNYLRDEGQGHQGQIDEGPACRCQMLPDILFSWTNSRTIATFTLDSCVGGRTRSRNGRRLPLIREQTPLIFFVTYRSLGEKS